MKHIAAIAAVALLAAIAAVALLAAGPALAEQADRAAGTPPSGIEPSIGDRAEPEGNLATPPSEADDPEVIRKIQQQLSDLGYYGGEATGDYDRATREAWEAYRTDREQTAARPADRPTAKVPAEKPSPE